MKVCTVRRATANYPLFVCITFVSTSPFCQVCGVEYEVCIVLYMQSELSLRTSGNGDRAFVCSIDVDTNDESTYASYAQMSPTAPAPVL